MDNKINSETRKLNNEFQINAICREDLIEFIGKKEALKLNNKQMKSIARKMGDYFMYDYWDHLTEALDLFEIKRIDN